MKFLHKIIILFFIGFIFRFILELLFPYSAIGFDQMGYYVPMLYTNANPVDYFSVGFIYYLISFSLNLLLNNPVWTIKFLDSILSGIFIISLFIFAEFGIKNKYSFYISILAFFSFQSLMLDWSLQRNLFAFSIFLLTFMFNLENKKKIGIVSLLLIISGMTDPAIIPLEFFWFFYKSFKNKKYVIIPIILVILTIILIISATFTTTVTGVNTNNLHEFIFSFFFPANYLYNVLLYISLLFILFIPYLPFIPLLKKYDYRDDLNLKIPILGTFIVSSITIFTFFPRYLIEMASISILFIKDPKKYKLIFSIFLVILLLFSSSYIAMTNYNPSPYFYNPIIKSIGLNEIVSTSYLQSTVPLNDSEKIVKLFTFVGSNNSIVVSMLYMVSYAYEAGINPSIVINTNENYTLFLKDCYYYSSIGLKVYTVWWNNNGWYGIEKLPKNFIELKSIGNYSLFIYEI